MDVRISGERKNETSRDEIKQAIKKYWKLLITFLHCHDKLFDSVHVGMSDQ